MNRRSSLFQGRTLAFRFTLFSVLLSTFTGAAVGGILLRQAYLALRQQAEQGQLAMAHILAYHIDQGTSQAFQAVQVLAGLPEVKALDRRGLSQALSVVTSATELLDGVLAVDAHGKVLGHSHPWIKPELQPSTEILARDLDRVAHLHGTVLTETYRTKDGAPAVVIRAPIRRNGHFVGALEGIFLIPSHSICNLSSGRIGKQGFAYLVDRNGVALVHPVRARVLRDLGEEPAVRQLLHQGEGILQFTDRDGQDVLSAFARVDSAGWGVLVRRPSDEVYAPALRMVQVMSGLLGLLLVLGGLAMAALSRRLAQPLLRLSTEVELAEWGGKGAGVRLDPSDPAEVLRLGSALNQMEARLEAKEQKREAARRRAIKAERELLETRRLAALGQLAAGLAHELNNPLTVIQGSAQMLIQGRSAGSRRWLQKIVAETGRCKRLVADLLVMGRPGALKPQKLSLAAITREAWAQASMSAGGRASLELGTKTDLDILADPDRVKQVLVNLFVNALQASPGADRRVLVSWKAVGSRVVQELRDHGKGLSKETEGRAFQPFFTTKADGTGLGLPIASSLVRAHGGQLRLEPRAPGASAVLDWPLSRRPRSRP